MSRVRPIHSQNVPRADDSRTLSAPTTNTTSSMPLATPYTPLRMASLPVAHTFSMRVTGTSSSPQESARMPGREPVGGRELTEPCGVDVAAVEPLVDAVDRFGHGHRDEVLDAELEVLAEVGHARTDDAPPASLR